MKKSRLVLLISLFIMCVFSFGVVACGKTEPVNVKPVITVNGGDSYSVQFGETFTIPKITITDDDTDTLDYSIKVTNGSDELPVTDGTFVATKNGTNIITITVTDKDGNTVTKQLSVVTTTASELNSFDDEARISNVVAKGAVNLSLNTDANYIKEGDGSLKMTVQEVGNVSWPGIIVNNLPTTYLLDDYSISFWMFNDGEQDLEIYLNRNESVKAKYNVPAKVWTKIEVTQRNYDRVFKPMSATMYEPAVGSCEDIKCFTFHFTSSANTPTFDIYVDNLTLNKTKVVDTLELSTHLVHPVVNQAYTMPSVTSYLDGEEVDADVTYTVYDTNYNKLAITDNVCSFTQTGKYTLIINAKYGEYEGAQSYMLICANSRAENEIDFFESELSLNFIESKHFKISYNTTEKHTDNNSTGSLKFHSNAGVWPYATIKNVPHADLSDVAYIYFFAKTDYAIQAGQTAYIGFRNDGNGKVIKRWALSNDWTLYTYTVEQLKAGGITSLDGLQFTVEFKDPSNPQNQGGWCPIVFNTYIDNFSAGLISEPTAKEENVVLDFANYRDAEMIDSNGYTSYNFYYSQYTVNNKGSLKFSASGKWPTFTFTSALSNYSLENVKYLVLDVFVPTISDGGFVRLGANDSGYQKINSVDAGKWVQLFIPYSALAKNGATSLAGITINGSRDDGSGWVNLGTIYIGKISFSYEEPQIEFFGTESTEDLLMFTPTNSLYNVAVNKNTDYIIEGETSFKFSASQRWPSWKFSTAFLAWLTENEYDYLSFKIYFDEANGVAYSPNSWKIHGLAGNDCAGNVWHYVNIAVTSLTASTELFSLNKNVEGRYDVYLDDVQFLKTGEFSGDETVLDLAMFTVGNTDYKIALNSNATYVLEGETSIKLSAVPRWPQYFFAQEFIDWLNNNGYTKLYFAYYIDGASSSTSVTQLEGVLSNTAANRTPNTWIDFSISVSSLTSSKYLQFNKPSANNLSVYIDNVQFLKDGETPIHIHYYKANVVEPTCTEGGYTEHACSCGDSYTDNVLPKLNHSFTNYVSNSDATCTEDGTKTATCDNGCGETDTIADTDSKLGHSFTNYVSNNDAEVNKDGTETATCDNGCGATDTRTDEGSALPEQTGPEPEEHTCVFVDYVSDNNATCTTNCTETATCTVENCTKTDTRDILDSKLAHDFENGTYVTDETSHWKKCADCDAEDTDNKAIHTGGTATFTSKAICTVCNVGYGDKLQFTAEETDLNKQMFTPKNALYQVSVNTNTDFIVEGDTSFKFAATQRWPEWTFSSTFLTWLTDNNYGYISFKIYFDLANAGTGFSSATGYINGLAGTDCATDKWISVTAQVSSLTTSTKLFYLNKAEEKAFNVYIDDVEFFKSGEFTGEEKIIDLAMFTLSGNASIAVNTNSAYINEGDTSLRLYSPSRWPKYTFTQEFIDWLNKNEYTTLSFDYYIDAENSSTTVSKLEGVISNTDAHKVENTWISFSISVSSLTSSKYIQFNRPEVGTLSVYLDNVQFTK